MARVHDGGHLHVFVSASLKICIAEFVCVFKCNSARALCLEFPQLKLRLWGGHLWPEGYLLFVLLAP
jgi:putative transposase